MTVNSRLIFKSYHLPLKSAQSPIFLEMKLNALLAKSYPARIDCIKQGNVGRAHFSWKVIASPKGRLNIKTKGIFYPGGHLESGYGTSESQHLNQSWVKSPET